MKGSRIRARQLASTYTISSLLTIFPNIRYTNDTYAHSSFERLHNVIFPRSVTEFIYRYNAADRAHVFLSFIIQTSDRAHEVADVLARLAKEDMQGVDISDDELAKAHGRYLAGGRADVEHERVFRFGKYVDCGGRGDLILGSSGVCARMHGLTYVSSFLFPVPH